MPKDWLLPEEEYGQLISEAFQRYAAADGSIPPGKVGDLVKDVNRLLGEAVHEARDRGYEEGHLGEDL